MKINATYHSISEIKVDPDIKYIWLASWYPSKVDVFNGDFIQRHAKAFSKYEKLLVIHIIYIKNPDHTYIIEYSKDNNLTEIIFYINSKDGINNIYSKLYYNIKFHIFGLKLINFVIKHLYELKLIHVHVPIKMGRLAWVLNKLYKIPYIISEHSGRYSTHDEDSFENRGFFYRYSLYTIIQNSLEVLQVSQSLTNKFNLLFKIRKQSIVRNVVDESKFYFIKKKNPIFKFIHVSTLNYEKNLKGILEAFETLYRKRKDFALTIIGNIDTLEKDLSTKSLQQPYLDFKGLVAYDEVAYHMKQSDCFVLFSRNENFPCVIIESLCCGIPVISTDVGGCAEAINDQNGILIENENVQSLIKALENMMDAKKVYEREKISQDALTKYNMSKIGSDFINIYKDLNLY